MPFLLKMMMFFSYIDGAHHFCGLHFIQTIETKMSGTQYAHEIIYVIFIPAAQ